MEPTMPFAKGQLVIVTKIPSEFTGWRGVILTSEPEWQLVGLHHTVDGLLAEKVMGTYNDVWFRRTEVRPT